MKRVVNRNKHIEENLSITKDSKMIDLEDEDAAIL